MNEMNQFNYLLHTLINFIKNTSLLPFLPPPLFNRCLDNITIAALC